MPFFAFVLVLFLEPACLLLFRDVPYWEGWNGAWLDAFVVGAAVAVAQVVGSAVRRSR